MLYHLIFPSLLTLFFSDETVSIEGGEEQASYGHQIVQGPFPLTHKKFCKFFLCCGLLMLNKQWLIFKCVALEYMDITSCYNPL